MSRLCNMMDVWKVSITGQMIGLESVVAVIVIFMIANIQTLGVPIRFASLPGTASTALGIVLIPTLGFVLDRWGKSRKAKARILALTTSFEFIGLFLVLTANTLKLFGNYKSSDGGNGTNITYSREYTQLMDTESKEIRLSPTIETILKDIFSTYSRFNKPTESIFNETGLLLVYNSSNIFDNSTSLLERFQNVSAHSASTQLKYPTHVADSITPQESWDQHSNIFSEPYNENKDDGYEMIPYFAYFAMVGYCLMDCGYDSSNCFLKTFALDCTPEEHHTSVIVKSIMISALGGVIISVLGSIDLGDTLTRGTNYDSNSAIICLLVLLTLALLGLGTLSTMLTGFFWRPPIDSVYNEVPAESDDEKSLLISSGIHSIHELSGSYRSEILVRSQRSLSHHLTTSIDLGHNSPNKKGLLTYEDYQPGILGFLRRNRKQVIVNMSAFTMISSLYAFEVFAVNFVGISVFGGDPAAESDSDEYKKYLHGVAVGSQGTLIYYIVFAVCSVCHERSLAFFGWKVETIVSSLLYVVLCLVCAFTNSLWAYYATAVWTGTYRTVAVSVPYILANKFSAEKNGGKSSSTAMATVAAMLPCGFLVCSALMGPLIDATGNPATPLFYSAACALVGCFCAVILKD